MERRTDPYTPPAHSAAALSGGAESGFTFAELLAVVLFVSLLGGMTQAWVRAVLHSARVQEAATELQEAAVMATDVIARDLRVAGHDGGGSGLTAVRRAGGSFVEIVADLNGDGDTADAHEHVAYAHRPHSEVLARASGAGRPQPLVRHVPADGVSLRFFDGRGRELVPVGEALPADLLPRIRRIDVRLRVARAAPGRGDQLLGSEVSTSVCLRNG